MRDRDGSRVQDQQTKVLEVNGVVRHRVGFSVGLFLTGFGLRLCLCVSDCFCLLFETRSYWFLGVLAPPRINKDRFRTNKKQSETIKQI